MKCAICCKQIVKPYTSYKIKNLGKIYIHDTCYKKVILPNQIRTDLERFVRKFNPLLFRGKSGHKVLVEILKEYKIALQLCKK